MPVRKIPKNHLFVTGAFASHKSNGMVAFESTLEKEYMLLLDFDDTVHDYEGQPVRVPLTGGRSYVPDLLVRFNPETSMVPQLTEIKTTEDLRTNSSKYAEKFEAAKTFATTHGWQYAIKTELDIRTPRLQNLKFLRGYRRHEADPIHRERIVEQLHSAGGFSSSEQVLASLAMSKDERALCTSSLWAMVIAGELQINLDDVMPHDVPLWLPERVR